MNVQIYFTMINKITPSLDFNYLWKGSDTGNLNNPIKKNFTKSLLQQTLDHVYTYSLSLVRGRRANHGLKQSQDLNFQIK